MTTQSVDAFADSEIEDRICLNLRTLMKLRSMSAADLGKELGMRRSTVYAKLAGDHKFSIGEIYRAARVLDVPIDALMGDLDARIKRPELWARLQPNAA